MLNDKAIKSLARAVDALNGPATSAGAWDALEPLSRLADDGTELTIDLRATAAVGAPVILARRADPRTRLFAPLTGRQRQVAEMVTAGLPNKAIARRLGIGVGTVKDHVHAVLTRLGLATRAELIAAALSHKP